MLGSEEYKVIKNFELNDRRLVSLFFLYGNATNKDAIMLYLALATSMSQNKHSFLYNKLNFEKDDLKLNRILLEKMGLLKTYYNKHLQKYVYYLLEPLNIVEFSKTDKGLEIIKNLDHTMIEYLKKINHFNQENLRDFEDISNSNEFVFITKKEVEVSQFIEIQKPTTHTIVCDDKFDIQTYFSDINPIIFPISLRTKENIEEINRLTNLFGLNLETLKKYLAEVCDFENNLLDLKRFEILCLNSRSNHKHSTNNPDQKNYQNNEDIYLMDCVNFLKYVTKTEVTLHEKNTINFLSKNYGFKNYIINVLLEYILKNNDHVINKNYLLSIADTWKRKKLRL